MRLPGPPTLFSSLCLRGVSTASWKMARSDKHVQYAVFLCILLSTDTPPRSGWLFLISVFNRSFSLRTSRLFVPASRKIICFGDCQKQKVLNGPPQSPSKALVDPSLRRATLKMARAARGPVGRPAIETIKSSKAVCRTTAMSQRVAVIVPMSVLSCVLCKFSCWEHGQCRQSGSKCGDKEPIRRRSCDN